MAMSLGEIYDRVMTNGEHRIILS